MADDRYKYFRIEARELLEQMGQGALDLEKHAPSADDVQRLLRRAHTLKGAARVVKQTAIAEAAHTLEDLFATFREATTPASREQVDRVLALLDDVGRHLAAIAPATASGPPAGAASTSSEPVAIPSEPAHGFRPDSDDLEGLADGISEAQGKLGALRPRLDQADRILEVIDQLEDRLARWRSCDETLQGPIQVATPREHAMLDSATALVDELRQRFKTLRREMTHGADQLERELMQIGDTAMRLRLVSTGTSFRFLEQAARDAARGLAARVRFEGIGGDVRVDSGMLTIVQGALLQMVRNAVAHGMETSEVARVVAGKLPEGRVTVAVSRRGPHVVFTCTDDGRGVDVDAVRRSLQRKGIAVASHAADDDTILRLLMESGISTSQHVTDLSGRGIGLGVIREAAEQLGGQVRMQSERGEGTTVELIVPFAIASFPALLVDAADISAAVPLDAVRSTLRVRADDIVETPDGDSILLDGLRVPFSTLLHTVRPAAPRVRAAGVVSAFVVDAAGGKAAIAVDRIRGTATVVTRALPDLAPALSVVVGASLDAAGQPRLVFDPAALVADAQRPQSTRAGEWLREVAPVRRTILVVDDSLTTRMLEQSILESAGYDVALASSAEEGLARARAERYALFLVDVEMPGMDGFTFIEQTRADPQLRDVPSILVTSCASADDRRRGRDAGARGYVVKGEFDQAALLAQIGALVQ